jgi:hypothetical protein
MLPFNDHHLDYVQRPTPTLPLRQRQRQQDVLISLVNQLTHFGVYLLLSKPFFWGGGAISYIAIDALNFISLNITLFR